MSVGAYAASDCESEASIASSTRSRGCVTHGRYVGLHRQRRVSEARRGVGAVVRYARRQGGRGTAEEGCQGGGPGPDEFRTAAARPLIGEGIHRRQPYGNPGGRCPRPDKVHRTEGLLAENARLSRELEELRGKIQSVEKRTAPAALDFEAMQRAIMVSVGTMMDAKLAGLTAGSRQSRFCAALAADGRRPEAEATGRGPKPAYNQVLKAAPAPKPASKTAPKTAPKPAPRPVQRLAPKPTPTPDPKPAKGKAKTVAQPAPALVPAPEEAPVASTSEAVDEGWTTVSKKKKPPKPKAPERPKAQPERRKEAPPQKKKGGPKAVSGKQRRKRAQRQRRLARTAAVVLTITPEAEREGLTYATVLTKARAGVDLNAMGIDMAVDPIRIRKAQTGARVLQLPKNVGREAADEMAKKLEAIYDGDVRVTRPVRCAELRVSNLDDSVTKEEIRDVAARQSPVRADNIKWGPEAKPGQKFSAVLKCPLEAVPRLVTTKTQKFLVGGARQRSCSWRHDHLSATAA
ncbi:KH domain-containing protein 3-like [Trichoplusia ni]|uniref:KH domain-containing protein 3-like n=1 Tax=Trichoplusia ni TaxID=7111 RepID=A0A7E5X0L0_TRINI|nr:KH domain-containing protein 3-like [Trichoplusia ni]